MYVETSAIVAMVLAEPDHDDLLEKLLEAEQPVTSVVSKVEAALSVGREIKDYERATRLVADFLDTTGVRVVDAPADIYEEVLEAYSRYGKGTGHSARLNFGDCFSYAFAVRLNRMLLFKGRDFSLTDLNQT